MQIQFFGATHEVTGSCYSISVGDNRILVECGLIQGSHDHEHHNRDAFPFSANDIDAVILSHAHIDHSGRIPLLVKRGFKGPIYSHNATLDLCAVMLEDSGYLNEKNVLWENKKRERKGFDLVEALYTKEEAKLAFNHFKALEYAQTKEILPGIKVTLHDAGHILGSAIIELELKEDGHTRKIVFSGDLGHKNAPILRNPEEIGEADLVVMESTYGDRGHRGWDSTWKELGEIISNAKREQGNILIPAFTVGRTQELLYALEQNYENWNIGEWQIFLDSPMGIKATEIYASHAEIYDQQAKEIKQKKGKLFNLPNLHFSERTEYSMKINRIKSGAIIIAGSGMCTGGRIKQHLKHNVWRHHSHVLIIGYQAKGTLGRTLVDGAKHINLWGENVQVNAKVHTVGGLSAHADQQGLVDWYAQFKNRPQIVLVHGEPQAMDSLKDKLFEKFNVKAIQADYKQKITL
jgi:metallo-beta-lactamase family protein